MLGFEISYLYIIPKDDAVNMPQTFSMNNFEFEFFLFRYARGIVVRHLGTSNLRNKRLFNQSMISKYLPILFAVFANSTVLSVMWAWWDPRSRLINLLKSAESDEWRSFECRLYFLSTYHCLKVNYSCLTILPTTRDCPGLSSLLWWEHSKHYFDAQNMYLHLLSRQITLLELNLHNYLEIFLWKFVWKFVFRLNSWKTDKAYMSPAIWQLGKWRQHIFKQLFSLLQSR